MTETEACTDVLFVGACCSDDGFPVWRCRPAPLLKNAALSESKARQLYLQVVHNMRTMYQQARLVHADLSEFNMLYVPEPCRALRLCSTSPVCLSPCDWPLLLNLTTTRLLQDATQGKHS